MDSIQHGFDKALLRSHERLEVVDSHTCGQPTRVILSGTGIAAGITPKDAREYLAEEAPWVRRVAVLEPRGHRSMFGAAAIPPKNPGGHWGVVFMDAETYPDMCGHATIGTATTLIELGLISLPDGRPDSTLSFIMHAPAGILYLEATIVHGRCQSVTFQTPLAYFVGSVNVELDTGATANVDIGYGGQYYGFIPSSSVGLEIQPDNIDALVAAAARVRAAVSERLRITDHHTGHIPEVGNIVWTSAAHGQEAHARNVPVSKAGSYDRSPCGTATCARMAVLVAQNRLMIGEDFINESILGTRYHGKAVSLHPDVDSGIVPRVSGSAWLTAHSMLLVDSRDPLGMGYLIGGGKAVI